MSRAVRLLLVALAAVVAAAAVVAGGLALAGADDDPPASGPAPAGSTSEPPVALADVDTTTVAVTRAEFCDAVDPDAVEQALGGSPTAATAYRDGQEAALTGTVEDVAHEFGCGWSRGPATARAWVFAPPVTVGAATALVREVQDAGGCTPSPRAAAYGDPTVALLCRVGRGGLEASHRGLFGDAWLTCTVTGRLDRGEALARADAWCLAVLDAVADRG